MTLIAFTCRDVRRAAVFASTCACDNELDRKEPDLKNEHEDLSTNDILRSAPMIEELTTDELVRVLLMQRIVERTLVFVTIVALAIMLALFLRKSAQKIALDGGAGLRVTALFSMPVFLLLVLVGFSYIVYTAPITVIVDDQRVEIRNLEDDPTSTDPQNDARAAPPRDISVGSLRRKALAFARSFRGQDLRPSGPLLAQLREGGSAIDTYLQSLVQTAPSAIEILALSEEFDWVFDTPSHAAALEAAIDEKLR
ncbi:MAG: hypothetical protein AAF088_11435 [Pseudomonadota bacterium]